ncbi:MAG: uracil-DNA glycosylase [Thermoplasmata archaeon]|nr:uracil-DNA glycosylase [Thermoplasmata archaeon]MCI4356783.1 uracil-DNA glycosylase [Thermoplasmata archaeon]
MSGPAPLLPRSGDKRSSRGVCRPNWGDRLHATTEGPVGSEWQTLSDEIRSCTRCPLHRTRAQAVVYRGGPNPSVVFVGEAPGAEEDRLGRPFVGRSGRLLDESVAGLGVPPESVGMINVLKCRPPKNVFVERSVAACRPYLDRQLALLAPGVVVPLGAHALGTLDPSAPRITDAAGRPRTAGPWRLFPLLHPAAALRSRRNLARWRDDVGRLRVFLDAPANG